MKNNSIVAVYKPQGKTPLQAIGLLKNMKDFANRKISYAGRLDPMAEGVLLLLLDNENKKRQNYENLTKDYVIDILFGVTTDSYDVLGKITNTRHDIKVELSGFKAAVLGFKKRFEQSYPPYSSKPVGGKPLYYWSRKNELSKIKIPKKEVEIYDVRVLGIKNTTGKVLNKRMVTSIEKVDGDFRQEEILKGWSEFFIRNREKSFYTGKIWVKCSSGTYMRSLAVNIGIKLGVPALALKIKRTRVGEFTEKDSIRI